MLFLFNALMIIGSIVGFIWLCIKAYKQTHDENYTPTEAEPLEWRFFKNK